MKKVRIKKLFTSLQAVVCVLLTVSIAQSKNRTVELIKKEKLMVVNIRTVKTVKPMMNRKRGGHLGLFGKRGRRDPLEEFFGHNFMDRFFSGGRRMKKHKERSLGSGVFIAKDGYIVTNFHVIAGADEIVVKTTDNKKYTAKVIGKDKKTDLALIKIDAEKEFPFAKLGSSDAIEVGESVIAIGNPFGLEQTVTKGIISAKGRVIGSGPYDDFLQTDASINPGNSGGPLFNMDGEVVGINTAIVAAGQGIGFAIPIDLAKTVINQLKDNGKVTRGWLGVMIQQVTPELAKNFGLKNEKGALVADVVKGSPAEKSGIMRGDVITKLDGEEIKDTRHLSRKAAGKAVGKKLEVEVVRKSKTIVITVVIGEFPYDTASLGGKSSSSQLKMGITVQDLAPEIKKNLGIEADMQGVLISDVEIASPAEEAGLRRGDIIIEVNRVEIKNVKDYQDALEKDKSVKTVLFLIKRESGTIYIPIKIEE